MHPDTMPTLGDAYALERELGGGGMSRVFVATEVALKRRVVVKLLGRELAEGLSAERFAREIELAAALQDPHIVPVLATGTTGEGLPYFTMPFVEGESLRERIQRGPIALDEALRILRDVAEALEYAHARGIVHRDIKPENILLSGRNAVVADFGIAKAVSAAREAGAATRGATLTSVGVSLGTPAYMSPEQAVGDPTDHRTDLYAWGMVAYELLAGAHPFAHRTTTQQLMAAQLTETPRALDEVRPGLPPSLGALVMRCLAKPPEARPADATALLASLGSAVTDVALTSGRRAPVAAAGGTRRTLLIAGVVAAVTLGGGALALRGGSGGTERGSATERSSTTPSLAVLPFEHQGDSADAYLTAGITDEIRNKLTGVQNLVVIARASSMQYQGKSLPPQQIAKELGVRWLLTGTVQVLGSGDQRRVLVRPELVEVTQDGRLQSKGGTPFDGPLTDLVKAQGDVATQVVGSMEVAVGGVDRAQLVHVPTRNARAYDSYLRGMREIDGGANSDPVSVRRALAYFDEALAADSGMAEAWAMVMRANVVLMVRLSRSPELVERARDAAARVEAMVPGSLLAYRTRAFLRRALDDDLTGALEDLQRAKALAPNDFTVIGAIGNLERQRGRYDEALRLFDQVARLEPRDASIHRSRAELLGHFGRFEDARAAGDRARALAPTSIPIVQVRIVTELLAGDLDGARRVYERATADIPRDRLLAFVATYGDLWWVPPESDQQRLLALGADAFGDDSLALSMVRTQLHTARGDRAAARRWASSAIGFIDREIRAAPDDPRNHLYRGFMLAHAGRSADAMAAVIRAFSLVDSGSLLTTGEAQYDAARIASIVGDRPRALEWLRASFATKGGFTPGTARIDPAFAPLRGDPAFERVLAEAP